MEPPTALGGAYRVTVSRSATPRQFKYLDILINMFVVVLLISNLVAQKIVQVGPFQVSAVLVLFPIAYIFGDIFTEVYGYGASRRAIWTGFAASALMALMGLFAVALPAAPGWGGQQAFETVFGFVPRLVIASLIAYWGGEFANAYVLARMKVLTKGRYLWMRTIGSTVVGQFVDTALVITFAFAGSISPQLIGTMILSGYVVKVVYEAAATPFTYLIVNFLKRREGIDVYDVETNFNPFHAPLTGEPVVGRAAANSSAD
jgi:queuosine precursor transporter